MNQETLFERMAGRSARPVRKGPQFIEEEPLVVDSGDCFRAFLAETTSHLYPANDEPGADIMKRIDFKMGNRLPQEWGMMPEIYTLLTMQSMLRGELQDRFNFTVMDGEPVVADYYIPVGHCRKNRPTLEWLPANMEIALSRRARFRRLLGGSAIFPEFS